MEVRFLVEEVRDSLRRRGFLEGYSPVEDVDAFVVEQALRWAGEVGEFCQRLAKDGGKDRGRLVAEWADAMIVGLAVGGLLNLSDVEIMAKLRLDERRGYRHNDDTGTDALASVLRVARAGGDGHAC